MVTTMPESEIAKMILHGGAFGLLGVLVVWVIFWGFPALMTDRDKDRQAVAVDRDKDRAHHKDLFMAILNMVVTENGEQRAFFLQAWSTGVVAKTVDPENRNEQHGKARLQSDR